MDAQLIIIGILWVKPNRKNHLSLYGLYELFAITDLLKFVFATIIHRVLFEINMKYTQSTKVYLIKGFEELREKANFDPCSACSPPMHHKYSTQK